jgi:hypothetical protein
MLTRRIVDRILAVPGFKSLHYRYLITWPVLLPVLRMHGWRGLNDGQRISCELTKDFQSGKMSADNLQA